MKLLNARGGMVRVGTDGQETVRWGARGEVHGEWGDLYSL